MIILSRIKRGVAALGILSAIFATESRADLDNDPRAQLGAAALECSVLANRSGQVDEERRLFELALAMGRELAPTVMTEHRESADAYRQYIGKHLTVDFILGTIYGNTLVEIDRELREIDWSGLRVPPERYEYDQKVIRQKARHRYDKQNCGLIR